MSTKKEQNKHYSKKQDAWLRQFSVNVILFFFLPFLSSLPTPPHLFSVVVLYTQGVESKQWREVRAPSCPPDNTPINLSPLQYSPPCHSSLPHFQGKFCKCQSLAIDWPLKHWCPGQKYVSCDWLRWQLLYH